MQKQYNVELDENKIFSGNLLNKNKPDSRKALLTRLGPEFAEKKSMLS